MIKRAFLPLVAALFMFAACGDNIHPDSDSTGDDDCVGDSCPSDVDPPDAGTATPDGDTGGNPDGGTGGGTDGGTGGGSDGGTGGTDGGTGGGTDGGTGGGTDGGTGGACDTCPEGQVCVDGACVCDHDGDPSNGGCAPDEVQLCHVPPGNPGGSHGICVGGNAAQAHLNHGDTLGACP